jgi:hypothetical protein
MKCVHDLVPVVALSVLAAIIPAACFANSSVDYLAQISTGADFETVTTDQTHSPNVDRVGKFVVPAISEEGMLPSVYQNVNRYPLHFDFLVQVFPDYFSGFSSNDYTALFLRRSTRQYFAGSLCRIETSPGTMVYGFDVATDSLDPTQMLTVDETRQVYQTLLQTFHLGPLHYAPTSNSGISEAMTWENPGFPILFPGDDGENFFQSYTVGIAYGRVRVLTLEELIQLNAEGGISWQDVLVIDSCPSDIEGVFAAVVTAKPQSDLSHLAIRSARRGSPNAYLEQARAAFSPFEGQLVRIEVADNGYSVDPEVTLEEAQRWWQENRPVLPTLPSPNLGYKSFDSLLEMNFPDEMEQAVARFGGKAVNLAKMYSFLPAEHQVPGFAIPFHYYQEFMISNQILDTQSSPPRLVSYKEYLEAQLRDPEFQTDPSRRMEILNSFQDYAKRFGKVDPQLVSDLIARISEVFGSTDVMVRFRSSSNVEDCLDFNGAGLYDSTSVCPEDSMDADEDGPSHCFHDQEKERTVERGLLEVWTSLWNFRAYEERSYYQVPQEKVAMGILVTTAFPDEAANGVIFTGDPNTGAEAGYVVNVQAGDESVVSPNPDVLPERDVLSMASGEVASILRNRHSTLVPDEWVLSDDQLRLLGRITALVEESFEFDLEGHERSDVLLDIEFKFTQSGNLIFKQVRPFLLPNVSPPDPSQFCQLILGDPSELCGWFSVGTTVEHRRDLMATIELKKGRILLPRDTPSFEEDLIDTVHFGPNLVEAIPAACGHFSCQERNGRLSFTYSQSFQIESELIQIEVILPTFNVGESVHLLNEEELLWTSRLVGRTFDNRVVEFAPRNLDALPLWGFDLNLDNGWRLLVEYRQLTDMLHINYRDALVRAELWTPEGHQVVTDYPRLAHTRENPDFLAGSSLLSLPSEIEGCEYLKVDWERGVSRQPTFQVSALNGNMQVVQSLEVLSQNPPPSQGTRFTEMMAINSTILADENGDYDPWIEIHNPTEATIELDCLYLSNDPSTPRQRNLDPMVISWFGRMARRKKDPFTLPSGSIRKEEESPFGMAA